MFPPTSMLTPKIKAQLEQDATLPRIYGAGGQQTQTDRDEWNELMKAQQQNIVRSNMAAQANPWISVGENDLLTPRGRAMQAQLHSQTANQRSDMLNRLAAQDAQTKAQAAAEQSATGRQERDISSRRELAQMEQSGRLDAQRQQQAGGYQLEFFNKYNRLPTPQEMEAFLGNVGGQSPTVPVSTAGGMTAQRLNPTELENILAIDKETMKLNMPKTIGRMAGMTIDDASMRDLAQKILKYKSRDDTQRDLLGLLAEEASRANRVQPVLPQNPLSLFAPTPELPAFTSQYGDFTVSSPQRQASSWNPFSNPNYEFTISGPGMQGTHGIAPGGMTRSALRSSTPEDANTAKQRADAISMLLKAYSDAQLQGALVRQ